jgi:hypothetical protein
MYALRGQMSISHEVNFRSQSFGHFSKIHYISEADYEPHLRA